MGEGTVEIMRDILEEMECEDNLVKGSWHASKEKKKVGSQGAMLVVLAMGIILEADNGVVMKKMIIITSTQPRVFLFESMLSKLFPFSFVACYSSHVSQEGKRIFCSI